MLRLGLVDTRTDAAERVDGHIELWLQKPGCGVAGEEIVEGCAFESAGRCEGDVWEISRLRDTDRNRVFFSL